MIRLAVVGLGKMGISHLSMLNAHPSVEVKAVCDASGYVIDTLEKYTGIPGYSDFDAMLEQVDLDAVVVATPSSLHAHMVRKALERGHHVFCEKPFCLDPAQSEELANIATQKRLVNQVGYHYRFVGAFQEAKRLLDAHAIGDVSHILAEAYGPVVLRAKGSTWRSKRTAGGGCLYDYAAHPINLVNWYLGAPSGVGGTVLNRIFSGETDDEVYCTLHYPMGRSAQISVNWSDESYRKMTTKITIWGSHGRIYADRQEIQVYLREGANPPPGYRKGWNVRYTTELTEPVWFYVRGEEYSSQLDHFVRTIQEGQAEGVNSFAEASITDRVISLLVADAERRDAITTSSSAPLPRRKRWFFFS